MTVRILHLIGSLRLGGAQIVLKQIVEHTDSNRFEHIVYPLRPKHQDIKLSAEIITNPYFNYDLRKFFDILRTCKVRKIDLIHAHLHKDILGGLISTYVQRIPVLVHEHGAIFQPGIQYKMFRLLLRLLKHRAAGFIATSQSTAAQLTSASGIDPSRIQVIYNAVDTAVFRPDADARRRIRQTLGYSETDTVIGFVGRLSPDKGIDLLVEAMGLLASENSAMKLLIVGSGPMEKHLREKTDALRISPRVHFAGFQPSPAEWINAFDIACLPSRYESFGLAAAEMMTMKIPLICTAVGGLKELTENGRNALVIRQNTPRHIASAIDLLAADAAMQATLSNNAFDFSRHFSIDAFISKIEALYSNLA